MKIQARMSAITDAIPAAIDIHVSIGKPRRMEKNQSELVAAGDLFEAEMLVLAG